MNFHTSSVAKIGDFAPNRRFTTCHWRKIFSLATGDFLALFSFFNVKFRKKVRMENFWYKNLSTSCELALITSDFLTEKLLALFLIPA